MSLKNTVPKKNEIAFTWFNHYAGVAIRTPTKTLAIDPVDVNAKTLPTPDAILITHEHYDHLDGPLVRKLQEMKPGTEAKVGDVTIRAEACNHPPATTPITFLVTSEDGVRVFHTADSMPFSEMKSIGEEHKPDIVFCTVSISPGTTPATGVEIVKLVKPKVAVPYHAASKADLNRFCEIMAKEAPKVKCLIAEQGNVYIVGKEQKKK